MKPDYKRLTSNLNYISVREKSAKTILDGFLERNDIQVVADPTLLLEPKDWMELVSKRFIVQNYVLVYVLGELNEQQQIIISNYASSNNLKVVRIAFASGGSVDSCRFGDELILSASPEEFLSLINYADRIFTDSFHACVFSILFRKQFYVFKRDNSNQMMEELISFKLFQNY